MERQSGCFRPEILSELSPAFIGMLRCPETLQPLKLAPTELLARLNAGRTKPLDAALVREDGHVAYPVLRDIPVLLIDEAIRLEPAQI